MPLVIRSTRVVTMEGMRPASVHVEAGRITAVAAHDSVAAAPSCLDVGDLVVMPGLVDTHVHVNEPGRTAWEGFETATAAAAAGGISTVVDMPLNSVPATTDVAAFETKRTAARGRVRVDVGFWGGIVPGNAASVAALRDEGVCGFKCFLVPSGVDEFPAVTEDDLRAVLPILAARQVPLLVHAEWPPALREAPPGASPARYATWLATRPERAEVDAIAMMIRLCREFRAPVHIVHLASAGALPSIRAARAEGLPLTVETCPHYLTFSAEEIPDGSTVHKCAPPIRGRAVRDALWAALADGTIDMVVTDHSPCPPSEKPPGDFLAAWGGVASLELSLAVVWTEAHARGVAVDRIATWMSRAPAVLAGLGRRKGAIREGLDADLVIWDPDAAFVVDPAALFQRHPLTPYAGRTLRGRVQETYVRGNLVYRVGARSAHDPAAGVLLRRAD